MSVTVQNLTVMPDFKRRYKELPDGRKIYFRAQADHVSCNNCNTKPEHPTFLASGGYVCHKCLAALKAAGVKCVPHYNQTPPTLGEQIKEKVMSKTYKKVRQAQRDEV